MFNATGDLVVLGLEVEGGLGRLMRLAKDWEFDEMWSSGMNLERWVVPIGLLLEAVLAVRKDEYD